MEILETIKNAFINALFVLWLGVFLIGCIYIAEKAYSMQKNESRSQTTHTEKN